MTTTPLTIEEVTDRLNVMRRQEEGSYAYQTYFPRLLEPDGDARLNVTWREKICQWSYNVVDHFELSREVVAISMSLFDRYLATQGNEASGNIALLTSLTTLHIAIKVHDSKKVKLSTLANLSRGQFAPKHIEEMERRILPAVGWKLHPPTQYAFVSHLLLLLPQEVSISLRKEIFAVARYMTELAVCDPFFLDVNNSTVAFAAILNVMDDIGYAKLSAGLRESFLLSVSHRVGLKYYSGPVMTARGRLRSMFAASLQPDRNSTPTGFQQQIQEPVSPSDVASMTGVSIASSGAGSRPRTNSVDSSSKGTTSFRYSPIPHRRRFVASVSPMGRAHKSCSPMVASVQ